MGKDVKHKNQHLAASCKADVKHDVNILFLKILNQNH